MTSNVEWERLGPMRESGVIREGRTRIAHLLLERPRIRIGRAVLQAGMVGHVFTHEQHRGKGYGRTLMEETHARMKQKGCDIAFLFGIRGYYYKLGYITVQSYYGSMMKVNTGPLAGNPSLRARAFQPDDLAGVMRLYTRENSARTSSFARNQQYWTEGPARVGMNRCLVLVDKRGRVRAYAKWGGSFFHARFLAREDLDGALVVAEAASNGEDETHALLLALERFARRKKCARLFFLGPPDHTLSKLMFKRGSLQLCSMVPEGGAQARILKISSLFRKLEGELSACCLNSPFAGKTGTVSISTELGGVSITARKGVVSTGPKRRGAIDMPAQSLMACLFGIKPAPACSGVKGELLRALLPARTAHSWPLDESI